jgi:hypothetical protein
MSPAGITSSVNELDIRSLGTHERARNQHRTTAVRRLAHNP